MAIVASTMTMPAAARTARSLTTGNGAGRPQTVRLSNRWPKLFHGDVSMCARSGLGPEGRALTVVDWAIVDSLRAAAGTRSKRADRTVPKSLPSTLPGAVSPAAAIGRAVARCAAKGAAWRTAYLRATTW